MFDKQGTLLRLLRFAGENIEKEGEDKIFIAGKGQNNSVLSGTKNLNANWKVALT